MRIHQVSHYLEILLDHVLLYCQHHNQKFSRPTGNIPIPFKQYISVIMECCWWAIRMSCFITATLSRWLCCGWYRSEVCWWRAYYCCWCHCRWWSYNHSPKIICQRSKLKILIFDTLSNYIWWVTLWTYEQVVCSELPFYHYAY